MTAKHSTYKQAGVDVDIEAMGSTMLYRAAKKTFENRRGNIGEILVPFDDFSGLRMIDVSQLPKGSFLCMGFGKTWNKRTGKAAISSPSLLYFPEILGFLSNCPK